MIRTEHRTAARPSYDMLPAWSAQRKQYEAAPPKEWQRQVVKGWIADYTLQLTRIEEIGAQAATDLPALKQHLRKLEHTVRSGSDVFAQANHKHALAEAREALNVCQSTLSSARKDYRRITALKAAAEQWLSEGEDDHN
jgi:ABC-type uncharacterized transport system fused permease/ATPase subunit